MKSYKLNYEKSKEVFELYEDLLEKNMCYFNVFKLSTEPALCSDIIDGKVTVCYGALSQNKNSLCITHCFLKDENDTIIDATLLLYDNVTKHDVEYYICKEFDDMWEYVDMIHANDMDPSLCNVLEHEFLELMEQLMKVNKFLL